MNFESGPIKNSKLLLLIGKRDTVISKSCLPFYFKSYIYIRLHHH